MAQEEKKESDLPTQIDYDSEDENLPVFRMPGRAIRNDSDVARFQKSQVSRELIKKKKKEKLFIPDN